MRVGNKFELAHIFSNFKKGMKAKDIAAELNLSKSNMSYYTKKLKDLGILKYIGNGIWEVVGELSVVQNILGTRKPTNADFFEPTRKIRGHAFIWKVKFEKDMNWEDIIKKTNIKYKIQSAGRVIRIFFNKRKIWLNKKGDLTIYEPFDYFGRNAFESKGMAVYNLDKLLKDLFSKLNKKILNYKFTTSRVHYALIKNEVAKQYNKSGEKLSIKTESGTEWLWIDNSKGFNELESGYDRGESGMTEEELNKGVQEWHNSNKRTSFKVTSDYILNGFDTLTKNQKIMGKDIGEFAVQLNRHIPAYEGMAKFTGQLLEEVKNLRKEIADLKK